VRFRQPADLVQNGVDTASFYPASRRESAKPRLLFVGRFVEKKGLPILRELAGRLPQAQWHFAGWGALDPARWGLPNVSVTYSANTEQLRALYQAADLLVLPSVGEGFPLSVQESMACGTPALVGEDTADGAPEARELLLRERVGGTDTAERWAGRIAGLLANAGTLEALRPRVAAFAREHWSWQRCTARYAELLRACVQ